MKASGEPPSAIESHPILIIPIRAYCKGDPQMKFHIYKHSKGEWPWRLKAANAKIVADSSEGHSSKFDPAKVA